MRLLAHPHKLSAHTPGLGYHCSGWGTLEDVVRDWPVHVIRNLQVKKPRKHLPSFISIKICSWEKVQVHCLAGAARAEMKLTSLDSSEAW